MASSALAYDLQAAFPAVPERHETLNQKPDLRVHQGKRPAADAEPGLAPLLKNVVAVAAVAVFVVTLTCIGRIVLINMTAEAAMAAVELDAAISAARSEGLKLAMQHALLASSTTIQKQASLLGMIPVSVQSLPAADSLSVEAISAVTAAVQQAEAERAAAAESLAASQRAAEASQAAAQRAAENAADMASTAQTNDAVAEADEPEGVVPEGLTNSLDGVSSGYPQTGYDYG